MKYVPPPKVMMVPTCPKCHMPVEVTVGQEVVSWCECEVEHKIKDFCVLCYMPIKAKDFLHRGNFCENCHSKCGTRGEIDADSGYSYVDYLLIAGLKFKPES